jgi:ATP-dependent DNA helicase RecQ
LFVALREARRSLAAAAKVPAYFIFHDSTLREIASVRPRSLAELSAVNGVGESKVRRYGEAMLATVRSHAGAARADADVIGRL